MIPDQSNPQSWNRFSYTRNNPVRYSDPGGHDVCDEEGSCYSREKGKYRNPNRIDWATTSPIVPSDPDDELSGKGSGGERENCNKEPNCRRHNNDNDLVSAPGSDEYLNGIFDPWSGTFYPDSPTDEVDMLWLMVDDLYSYNRIDFDAYARNGESNPLTFDQINNGTAHLGVGPFLTRALHVPYQIFLAQVGVPHDIQNHITNYEPQYLSALMKYHPRELEYAKQEYGRLYPDAYYDLIQDWGPGPLGPDG